MRLLLLSLLSLASLVLGGCTPGPAGECTVASDCGSVESPPCERCPAPTAAFCVAGACEERGAATVDVTATLLVARALDGVNGLAWALAVDDRACAALAGLEAFPADLNVFAAGQKTLSGGDLHPDLQLAPVPEGPLLLVALATSGSAGDGDVLGAGCAQANAQGAALAIPQTTLE